MPGSVQPDTATAVLPKNLCSAFSITLEFASQSSIYKNGEYQLGLLVSNERRTWKLARKLTPSDADALVAFYLARGGPAGVFWFYDPYDSPAGDGSNWDATGTSSTGRYAVRFDGSLIQAMNAPGRLLHDFMLKEIYAVSGIASAVLHITSTHDPGGCYVRYGTATQNLLNDGDTWSSPRTDDFTLSGITTVADLFNLAVLVRNYNTTNGDIDPPSVLSISDIWVDVTFTDGTTTTFRPTSLTINDNSPTFGTVSVTSIDPTVATITRVHSGSLVDGNICSFAVTHFE